MLSRNVGVLLFSVLVGVGCSASEDDGRIADKVIAGEPDATPTVSPESASVQMYVHSRDTLYSIDDTQFALTEIGRFLDDEKIGMIDLAVTPDGDIYTISTSTKRVASVLYKVDPLTGKATAVGNIGKPGEPLNVGMTFLIDGSLLATDKDGGVRKINPKTGQVTEIGAFGDGYATAGDLVGVDDGRMFAISDKGPKGNEDDNNVLIVIDPLTGEFIRSIGQIGWGRVYGSAVANGRIYAFTSEGYVIEINPANGVGTERKFYKDISFWGAGVTPRASID